MGADALRSTLKYFYYLKRVQKWSADVILQQWFLNFFTYLTLLSNKVTRFTHNAVIGAHLLKLRN